MQVPFDSLNSLNPKKPNILLYILSGGGGEGTWVKFSWVCAAGLSEPLPHYSLFCGHFVDPILITLGKK